MDNKLHNIRYAYIVSGLAMLALTILSAITFKERTLFVDSAWFVFNILNTKSFFIVGMRYGAFITQLGALAAIYLGLSLQWILFIFSVGFYLFYYIAFYFIGTKWRQKQLAILFCLFLVIFAGDGYFFTVGEIFQGVAWMFLFFALYFRPAKHTILSHVLLVAFAFLGLTCHMIVLLPFAFLWLYLNIDGQSLKQLLKKLSFRIYSALLFILGFLRFHYSNTKGLDSMKLAPIHEISFDSVLNTFKSGHAHTFWKLSASNYWLLILISLIGLALLIQKGKFIHVGLVLLFGFSYFFLMFTVYPDAYDRSILFYFEYEWAALSIILCTPFVMQIFHGSVRNPKMIIIIFTFIISVRFCYLADACSFFHHRFKNLETVTDILYKEGIHKVVITEEDKTAKDYFIMHWGTSCESILLSELKGYKPAVTFKIVVDKPFDFKQVPGSFYSSFSIKPLSSLNASYFHIDSVQDYKLVDGLSQFGVKNNAAYKK